MKRFHVHLAVENLAASTLFYNNLFGQQPNVEKPDYVKWLLDDPMVNFAISNRGEENGLNHFGFQAADETELGELKQRAEAAAGEAILDEGQTTCCYANSEKHWVTDPAGIAWEHYHTMSAAQTYNAEPTQTPTAAQASGCCVPEAATAPKGCC